MTESNAGKKISRAQMPEQCSKTIHLDRRRFWPRRLHSKLLPERCRHLQEARKGGQRVSWDITDEKM